MQKTMQKCKAMQKVIHVGPTVSTLSALYSVIHKMSLFIFSITLPNHIMFQ